ncbi:hypothetical protein HDEF_0867 [Candidatus Hamiltonella defensa 5AT (Acyrthosiphon pisum)]|uniref:Uncharacterized protein n=1 Tax=Hamiltonella defensa subsp. Acyrthosiphon pisum (strain 5AT) TaxID=572265 RepID=C4K4U4_HAMD5|nr:hypothetical protein HDEF_0867 [Candidatus Hamiltonella defensa 5AT (Acyrthosiphon pisum)]
MRDLKKAGIIKEFHISAQEPSFLNHANRVISFLF